MTKGACEPENPIPMGNGEKAFSGVASTGESVVISEYRALKKHGDSLDFEQRDAVAISSGWKSTYLQAFDKTGMHIVLVNGEEILNSTLAKQIHDAVNAANHCDFDTAAKLANDLEKPAGGRGANGR